MKKDKFILWIFLIVGIFFLRTNYVLAANPSNTSDKCVLHKASDCPVNCAANKEYNFCSPDGLTYVMCGDAKDIPSIAPKLSSYAVSLLKTVAPIVLIIMSIVSLVKSIASGKEEDIKKAQTTLIKRLILCALVFFVVTIVQFVMAKVADSSDKKNVSKCLSCFLNGTDGDGCDVIYYKDGYGHCTWVNGNGTFDCSK